MSTEQQLKEWVTSSAKYLVSKYEERIVLLDAFEEGETIKRKLKTVEHHIQVAEREIIAMRKMEKSSDKFSLSIGLNGAAQLKKLADGMTDAFVYCQLLKKELKVNKALTYPTKTDIQKSAVFLVHAYYTHENRRKIRSTAKLILIEFERLVPDSNLDGLTERSTSNWIKEKENEGNGKHPPAIS